jgi:protease PrsW
MIELLKNQQALIFAILGGVVPAILWLWFWLHEEDSDTPEPKGLIVLSFILGGIMVIIAIWIEKYSLNFINNSTVQVVIWATIEELLKLAGILIILTGSNIIKEPIDYPMYFISCALGFAAVENVLYLLHLFDLNGTIVGMLTGNLRFLGSTLLHAIASGMIGSALGLSYYLKKYRAIYLLGGIICAVTLHSIFNFFIMGRSGENFLSVFGFLWVVAIINILIFEKLKRIGSNINAVNA